MSSDIQVHVRVRPLLSSKPAGPPSLTVTAQGGIVAWGRPFEYPSSIVQGSSQQIAYDSIAPRLLSRLQEGYSVTLLAYGQTGSGKTYTMFGPAGSLSETALEQAGANVVPTAWGIFPRMMMQLRRMPGLGSMHASAIEVYSNNAYDLLAHRAPIKIGHSASNSAVLWYNPPDGVRTGTPAFGSTPAASRRDTAGPSPSTTAS